jgi:hypothetical protein
MFEKILEFKEAILFVLWAAKKICFVAKGF